KIGWGASHSKYSWLPKDWDEYYQILMNNEIAYRRAVELNLEFHQGVCLIMKSFLFGMITDFWGDAPYTNALKGEKSEKELEFPDFDSQELIYKGIIADLDIAASLLSKSGSANSDMGDADVFFKGDPIKWMKFANSLALRYYMRLSEKLPAFAEAGVREMLKRPLIGSVDEEVAMNYIVTDNWEDSWPHNTLFDPTNTAFPRYRPCATLVSKLLELNDPRIHVWFAPVKISTKIVPSSEIRYNDWYEYQFDNNSRWCNSPLCTGIRYFNEDSMILSNRIRIFNLATYKQDILDGYELIDTNSVYVGVPMSCSIGDGSMYNYNTIGSIFFNLHISLLNDIFKEPAGDLLKARVLSFAEVCFLKAEAALKGWGLNAEENYNTGIKASLETWGIEEEYDSYITNEGVVFNGTLEQIMEQKWIASFTAASEAWFDWRRTGLPDLQTGPYPKRDRIPLRFYYGRMEKELNTENYKKALSNLEETYYTATDGPDSAWSKMWVLQGTGKPW
ncbi:MAG: SusD/RagB family nutrient-binding outer membrane lipoprotein, partial [Draconibacterium sp.]|nr:SusD/RagB family nutrient-binding outer membrane lipoprotein [Draconibacterium sp.]